MKLLSCLVFAGVVLNSALAQRKSKRVNPIRKYKLSSKEAVYYRLFQRCANDQQILGLHRTFCKKILQRVIQCSKDNPSRKFSCRPYNMSVKKATAMIAYLKDNPLGEVRNGLNRGVSDLDFQCNGDICAVPVGLNGLWGYGCWCNFGSHLMQGKGPVQNEHDAMCHQMQMCLRCVEMDGKSDGYTCDPRTQEFSVEFELGDDPALVAECGAANNFDPCATHTCTCEMNLMNMMVEAIFTNIAYDPSKKHVQMGGEFDTQAECGYALTSPDGSNADSNTAPPAGDGATNDTSGNNPAPSAPAAGDSNTPVSLAPLQCCGTYPERTPFRAGTKDCCLNDNTLYAVISEHC